VVAVVPNVATVLYLDVVIYLGSSNGHLELKVIFAEWVAGEFVEAGFFPACGIVNMPIVVLVPIKLFLRGIFSWV
jgi:hypothetical protein